MTTIIIKSFNRPYYLDRCLQSIKKNVVGTHEIKILDDGTPENYIHKLQERYPKIQIKFSKNVDEKRRCIEINKEQKIPINGFIIPTDLWISEVQNSSDYVLVIEDDVWFCEGINLDEIVSSMKKNSVPLTKLGWLGNYNDDKFCEVEKLDKNITSVIPTKLFTSNKFFMDLFMYNKLKTFTLLYKLGLVDNFTKRKYWAINSILMGLYQKEYWLAIWTDAKGKVDEKQQLRNAAAWYHKNKKAVFARTNQEVLKTTFKSSATGSYHEYGNHLDINRINFILNEAWLNGELDVMNNYPKDFSDEYIKRFLEQANHPDAQYKEWLKWTQHFKSQYRNLGAEVDN